MDYMNSNFPKFFVLVLALIFLSGGTWIIGNGLFQGWRNYSAGKWPTTPGVIDELQLQETETRGNRSPNLHSVSVQYRYTVAGNEYRGSTLVIGYSSTINRDYHQAIYGKLIAANRVVVRYHPTYPEESCLSHGIFTFPLVPIIFGTLLWVAVFMMLSGMGPHLFEIPISDRWDARLKFLRTAACILFFVGFGLLFFLFKFENPALIENISTLAD